MSRSVFVPVAVALCSSLIVPAAFAQAKPPQASVGKAAPTTSAPAPPAKFYKPVKGTATVDFIQGKSNKVGADIVTVFKIKNTSGGAIALIRVDEYWYDKTPKIVTGDTQRWRQPFNPGDVIELTLKSPYKPNLYRSQYQFSHANGEIKPTPVKAFK